MKKEHFEILLEDIDRKFQLILENHSALQNQLHEFRDESNAKHDHTAFMIKTLNDKIDGVDTKLSAKIDGVDAKLSARIDAVDAKLSARIDAVDEKLSARLDSVAGKLDDVAADLSAHRADTEAHRQIYGVKED